jgi:TRAP-type C4-dicarboxylate transport system permease small subunit
LSRKLEHNNNSLYFAEDASSQGWLASSAGVLYMRTVVKIIRGVFFVIEKFLEYLSMGMLVAMVIIICYQVIMRYVFNRSPSWSEEIAIRLMIWFGILSIPIGVKLHLHIGIEYIYNQFPKRMQWIVSRFIFLLITGFGFVMIFEGIPLAKAMMRSTLPATKLPTAVEYIVFPPAGVMLIYNALELFFVPYHKFLKQPGSVVRG